MASWQGGVEVDQDDAEVEDPLDVERGKDEEREGECGEGMTTKRCSHGGSRQKI